MNMTAIIQIGHYCIYPMGLCAAGAALIYWFLFSLFLKKEHRCFAPCIVCFTVLSGLVLSRFLYCLCNLSDYLNDYENAAYMLCFSDGGYSMYGIFGGLFAGILLGCKRYELSADELLDACGLSAPWAIAMIHFGRTFTELGTGKLVEEGTFTKLFGWALMKEQYGIGIDYRLNAAVYACLFCVLLGILMMFRKKSGNIGLKFFALYGAFGILLESIRDDGHMLLIAFLRAGQIFCIIMPLTVMLLGFHRRKSASRRWISGCMLTIGTAGIVMLEFMLDGRLTIGNYSMGLYYALMAVCCCLIAAAAMLALPRTDTKA